jgi:hypothetical protein
MIEISPRLALYFVSGKPERRGLGGESSGGEAERERAKEDLGANQGRSVHSQSTCAMCGGVLITTVPPLQGQLHVLLQPFQRQVVAVHRQWVMW